MTDTTTPISLSQEPGFTKADMKQHFISTFTYEHLNGEPLSIVVLWGRITQEQHSLLYEISEKIIMQYHATCYEQILEAFESDDGRLPELDDLLFDITKFVFPKPISITTYVII